MALSAVLPPASALDDGVKNWLVYWRRAGAPDSAADIVGEVSHPDPPTYGEVIDYLGKEATRGTIICVATDEVGAAVPGVNRIEFPIARRASDASPPPSPQVQAQAPDMQATMAGMASMIRDMIAPIAQRLDQIEQRSAASQLPVANAMGMGMDPLTSKFMAMAMERAFTPPAASPLQDRLMEIALASISAPREKDEMTAMVNHITKLRLSKELAREMRDLGREDEDQDGKEGSDDKDGDLNVMGVLKMAGDMIANRGQQPQQPTPAQLGGPTGNVFDSPADLQAMIMADPEKAAQAMRSLGRQYPEVAMLARKAMREGEKEAGGAQP